MFIVYLTIIAIGLFGLILSLNKLVIKRDTNSFSLKNKTSKNNSPRKKSFNDDFNDDLLDLQHQHILSDMYEHHELLNKMSEMSNEDMKRNDMMQQDVMNSNDMFNNML